jgi:hypothetical protein
MKTTLLSSALTLAVAACATTEKTLPAQPDGPAPGAVAVVPARHQPRPAVVTYAERLDASKESKAGAWAASGAKNGAVGMLKASVYWPFLLPFAPVLVPAGMLGGAAVGAGAGAVATAWDSVRNPVPKVAEEHRAPLRALLEHSLRDRPAHLAISAYLVESENDRPNYRLILQPDLGPRTADHTPNYHPLKEQSFDAVLEVAVTRVELLATGEKSPLVMELELRARALWLEGESAPWVRNWTHRSVERSASDWLADDGLLLVKELDGSYRALARLVADAALRP